MSRRASSEGRRLYPYLQRPIIYVGGFLLLMNGLKLLGVTQVGFLFPLLERIHLPRLDLPEEIQFNLAIFVVTIFTPVIFVLALFCLVGGFGLLKFFTYTNRKKLRGPNLNRDFFRTVSRKSFWKNYHYREILPALLYYNINAIILVPLGAYIFLQIFSLINHGYMWLTDRLGLGDNAALNAAVGAIVAFVALVCFYFFILRPLLYAVLFRSDLRPLRKGFFIEPLVFGALPQRTLQDELRTGIYLDIDLQPSPLQQAVFIQQTARTPDGKIYLKRIVPFQKSTKIQPPTEPDRMITGRP